MISITARSLLIAGSLGLPLVGGSVLADSSATDQAKSAAQSAQGAANSAKEAAGQAQNAAGQAQNAAGQAAGQAQNAAGQAQNAANAANAARSVSLESLNSSQISRLQTALKQQGEKVVVDGKLGAATTNALKDFQTKNGLAGNGQLNADTLAKLGVSPSELMPAH